MKRRKMRSQVKVSLLCPVFLPAGKNVLSICLARRICLEKFYFFFHFFVALIFEGGYCQGKLQVFSLDTEGLYPQDSLEY